MFKHIFKLNRFSLHVESLKTKQQSTPLVLCLTMKSLPYPVAALLLLMKHMSFDSLMDPHGP